MPVIGASLRTSGVAPRPPFWSTSTRAVPGCLPALDPGWSLDTDVCVVGSGIAGLCTALHLRQAGLRVTVVTKERIDDGSTRWAQGGIAAVLDPADSPRAHALDTHTAGVELCDAAAVDLLVHEGPPRLRELMRVGARFDRHSDGSLMLTREGGHRANRIVHAGGDATGAEVQRALHAAVHADDGIRLIEHALVLDLLRGANGRVAGVSLHVLGEGTEDGVGAVLARAVVLATGGMGQVFASTTNPAVSTGDGVALALRAGAQVADLEFVQFHPTALFVGMGVRGQQPLVSEALRGEGAYLIDHSGHRFMPAVHELAELAPRDVVAKAITRTMMDANTNHVFLDARHMGPRLAERFPTIVASCRAIGIDPTLEPIPVAPAAHYASGGVRVDLDGRTGVEGLYACGEVACTGVHGANRLASNSLLEGLVFSHRIAGHAITNLRPQLDPVGADSSIARWALSSETRATLANAMTSGAGVLRSAGSLADTLHALDELARHTVSAPHTADWEATNLHTVATALAVAASQRRETRGCHWREDFPHSEAEWRVRLSTTLDTRGLTTGLESREKCS